MSEKIEFHAKLATRGRVYIPKIMVERWMLWKETPIHVRVLLRGQLRSVEFDARVRSGFCLVIPQNELKVLQAEDGAYSLLKVHMCLRFRLPIIASRNTDASMTTPIRYI